MAKPWKRDSAASGPDSDTDLAATADQVAQAAAGKDASSRGGGLEDDGFTFDDEAATEIVTPAGSLLVDPHVSELADPDEDELPPAPATTAAASAAAKSREAASKGKDAAGKAGSRFKSAASDAGKRASGVASDARGRAAGADVGQFASNTTSLIDTARPFFLAGFAVAFAILGWIEDDSDTAQLFVFGSILFVLGAAFSTEIDAFVAHRFKREPSDEDQ